MSRSPPDKRTGVHSWIFKDGRVGTVKWYEPREGETVERSIFGIFTTAKGEQFSVADHEVKPLSNH